MATGDARLLEAATALFAEKGFHGAGIRELADRAGLSTAGLYHYMGAKEDLLRRIMTASLGRLLDAARATASATTDPVTAVAELTCGHVITHALRRDETRVVDGELRALSPAALAEVVALRDAYEAVWAAQITAGVAAGAFRVPAPDLARLAVLEMCSGVSRWYRPDGPLSLDDVATRHAQMVLSLLGTAPEAQSLPPEVLTRARQRVATPLPSH